MRKEGNTLTIIVGGSMEADEKELFSGKPLGEISQSKNTLYLDSFEQLYKLLSPAKLDLLTYLIGCENKKDQKSVSDIAKETHRHQEAVSRDLAAMKKLGLVSASQSKQRVFAKSEYAGISIRTK